MNKYILNDHRFYSYKTDENYFINFDSFLTDMNVNPDPIAIAPSVSVVFKLQNKLDVYERTVETFLDILGTVGGVYELTEIILGICVGYFAKQVYYFEIVAEKSMNGIIEGNNNLSAEHKDNHDGSQNDQSENNTNNRMPQI